MKANYWQDILIRFIIGGSFISLVYVLANILPLPMVAGMFAAFPGVMTSAVALAGWRDGSKTAADVAKGSIVGMIGCVICVVTVLLILPVLRIWWLALFIAVGVWFLVSVALNWVWGKIISKTTKKVVS